jgi:hypothetical protein
MQYSAPVLYCTVAYKCTSQELEYGSLYVTKKENHGKITFDVSEKEKNLTTSTINGKKRPAWDLLKHPDGEEEYVSVSETENLQSKHHPRA